MSRQKVNWAFSPPWEGPIRGWAYKFIRKNKWRCDPIVDLDDLMQDAFLVYLKAAAYYPYVREPRHFMALYKAALYTEIIDKQRAMRLRGEPVGIDPDTLSEDSHGGYVAALLAELPEELKIALAVLKERLK